MIHSLIAAAMLALYYVYPTSACKQYYASFYWCMTLPFPGKRDLAYCIDTCTVLYCLRPMNKITRSVSEGKDGERETANLLQLVSGGGDR